MEEKRLIDLTDDQWKKILANFSNHRNRRPEAEDFFSAAAMSDNMAARVSVASPSTDDSLTQQRQEEFIEESESSGENLNISYPPIRDQIFNDELKELTRHVLEHKNQTPLPAEQDGASTDKGTSHREEMNDAFESYPIINGRHDEGITDSLKNLYMACSLTDKDFDFFFYEFRYDFPAMAILFHNFETNVFQVLAQKGLCRPTVERLCIGTTDPFLPETEEPFTLSLTDELKNDIYFRKRFAAQFLDKYTTLHILRYGESLLLLFQPSEQAASRKMIDYAGSLLADLFPVLKKYATLTWPPPFYRDDLMRMIRSPLADFLYTGNPGLIVTVKIIGLYQVKSRHYLLKQVISGITNHTRPSDRTFRSGPSTVLVLLRNEPESAFFSEISSIASRLGLRLDISVRKVKGGRRNLLNLLPNVF